MMDPIWKETPLPESVAERFAEGWEPYGIPAMWIDVVTETTAEWAELYPDFKFLQIKQKFWEPRVYAERVPHEAVNVLERKMHACTEEAKRNDRRGA